ncbi:MAG: PulJ/GspJ family protein [Bacteriovoracia bacterium]
MQKHLTLFKLLKSKQGFTLIEIIVATALLSFMMIGVITVSNNNIETKETVVSEDNRKLQIQTALSRLERDLSQIYSPLYFSQKHQKPKSTQGEDQDNYYPEQRDDLNSKYARNDRFGFANTEGLPVPKILNDEKTSIEFMVSNNMPFQQNARQSEYGWVKYSLEEMEFNEEDKAHELGNYRLMRSFNATDPFSDSGNLLDESPKYEVLDYITEFEFNFWDRKNKKFVSNLRELPKEARNRIEALQVVFKWKGIPGMEPIKIMKTFLPLWPYYNHVPKKNKKSDSLYDYDNGPADDPMVQYQ